MEQEELRVQMEEIQVLLREILEAIYGIRIGDDAVGQAAERYNRKLNIARGGQL